MPASADTALRASLNGLRTALAGPVPAILEPGCSSVPSNDFARAASLGLAESPRRLESRFLYDARGSLLFDLITRQPEYYLTRTESSILAASARRIRDITGAVSIVELGSGSSEKTDHIISAWLSREPTANYIPVDVSGSALRRASRSISRRHPALRVVGLNADYRDAFPLFAEASPVLVVFLGSSIGNFDVPGTSSFLKELSRAQTPGDFFLAGFDLVKEPTIIEAAYNDSAGVTAEFTRNLFSRMNRELGSGIDLNAVEHCAKYDVDRERVEIDARFTSPQEIRIAPLGETFTVSGGERIRTEISRKFRLEQLVPYLESFRFRTREVFTDPRQWFGLVLLQRI